MTRALVADDFEVLERHLLEPRERQRNPLTKRQQNQMVQFITGDQKHPIMLKEKRGAPDRFVILVSPDQSAMVLIPKKKPDPLPLNPKSRKAKRKAKFVENQRLLAATQGSHS